MKYAIATGKNAAKLEKSVNALIELGWKPQGGVCLGVGEVASMCGPSSDNYWSQAMIKEDK